MFRKLQPVEDNLYKLSAAFDLLVLSYYAEERSLRLEGSLDEKILELPGMVLTISKETILCKTFGNLNGESVELVDALVDFLLSVQNPVEYVLTLSELNNFQFFKFVPDKFLSYDVLAPYLSSLRSNGLDFDTAIVEKQGPGSYFSIDCVDYIKFIPYDQYSKEKQVKQIIAELCEQTSKEAVKDWLQGIYRRYLLNNVFDSNGIHHILDWMNTLEDVSILQKSLSYDRALAKADQWIEMENQKLGISTTRDKEGVDVESLLTISGYELLKLLSQDSKKREGAKMHNCIGKLHLNNQDLYSIRYNGRRVASICFRDKRIVEAKGPWNKSVENRHQAGVRSCLESMGVLYQGSRDLANIGVRELTLSMEGLSNEALIVKQGEPLFDYPESYIRLENVFSGTKASQTEALKAQLLAKFPERLRETISAKLEELQKEFIPCPLTDYLFSMKIGYGLRTIPKLTLILADYPEFVDSLREMTLTYKESNPKNGPYVLKNLMDAASFLSQNQTVLDGDPKRKRKFLTEFLALDPSREPFVGLLQPVMGKKESIMDVYSDIASYTPFKKIERHLEEIDLILKVDYPDFTCDEFKPKVPDQCNACKNYEIYQEQSSIADEIKEKKDDADKEQEKIIDNFDKLKEFLEEVKEFYKKFHLALIVKKQFELGEGRLRKHSLSEAQELRRDLEEWRDSAESITESYTNQILRNCLSAVEEGHNFLEDQEKSISKLTDGLEKLMGEGCSKCETCYGDGEDEDGETCATCKGNPQECDGEKVVDGNRSDKPSVNYRFGVFSSWSKDYANLEIVHDLYDALEEISTDPQGFYRGVFEFFSIHQDE